MTYSDQKKRMFEMLVGTSYSAQIDMVESHFSDDLGVFMPELGSQLKASALFHSHPSYQFVISFDDKVTFEVNKVKITNRPGQITGFSPQVVHRESYRDHNPHYIVIFIEAAYYHAQMAHYTEKPKTLMKGDSIKLPLDLMAYLKSFMVESDNQVAGSQIFLQNIGNLITHSIIRGYLNVQLNSKRVVTRFEINCTLEYMHANYGLKLSLGDLALYAKMSKTHFSRVFKEETGQSVMDYLNDIRMENVKRMLMYSEKTITEIALDCGFQSSSYLSTSFQNRFGISPSAYKSKLEVK